jgi:hypothetical protein
MINYIMIKHKEEIGDIGLKEKNLFWWKPIL